jgi:hypothetical protein
VHAHIEGNRGLVSERLEKTLAAIGVGEQPTAFELVPRVYGRESISSPSPWLLTETLAMLLHLELTGRARRIAGEPERWARASDA